MRRAALAVALAVALLPACAGVDRPEGVVERWLASLNQGAAGRPDRYAPSAVSDAILPDRRDRDPGGLDTIEVGRGTGAARAAVPLRVARIDGTEVRATAIVRRTPLGWRVVGLAPARADLPLPSEGGPPIAAAGVVWWLGALGLALAFGLASEVLMGLLRRG